MGDFIINIPNPQTFMNTLLWSKAVPDIYTAVDAHVRTLIPLGGGLTIGPSPTPRPPTFPAPDWFRWDKIQLLRERLRIKRIILEAIPEGDAAAKDAMGQISGLPILPTELANPPTNGDFPLWLKIGSKTYLHIDGNAAGIFPPGDTTALPLEIEINGHLYRRP